MWSRIAASRCDVASTGFPSGKRVLIRSDLNVPLDEGGRIGDDTRIRASVPAMRLALDAGAAVMVTSHLGRPAEGGLQPGESLAPVAARLGELLGAEVAFASATDSLRAHLETAALEVKVRSIELILKRSQLEGRVDPQSKLIAANFKLLSVDDRRRLHDGRQRLAAAHLGHQALELAGLHDLRTRTSGTHNFAQFHVWVPADWTVREAHDRLDAVEEDLQRRFPGTEFFLHLDPEGHTDRETMLPSDLTERAT